MWKKVLVLFIFSSLVVLFQNCSGVMSSDDSQFSSEVEAKANFQYVHNEILIPKCKECHSGGIEFGGLNIMSYYRVMEFVVPGEPSNSRLFTRTFETTTFTLSEMETAVLSRWIENGAKND